MAENLPDLADLKRNALKVMESVVKCQVTLFNAIRIVFRVHEERQADRVVVNIVRLVAFIDNGEPSFRRSIRDSHRTAWYTGFEWTDDETISAYNKNDNMISLLNQDNAFEDVFYIMFRDEKAFRRRSVRSDWLPVIDYIHQVLSEMESGVPEGLQLGKIRAKVITPTRIENERISFQPMKTSLPREMLREQYVKRKFRNIFLPMFRRMLRSVKEIENDGVGKAEESDHGSGEESTGDSDEREDEDLVILGDEDDDLYDDSSADYFISLAEYH